MNIGFGQGMQDTLPSEISLSVIVRVVGGDTFLHRCLKHLVPQTEGRRVEIIVPYDSVAKNIENLKDEFPTVIFLDLGVIRTDAASGSGAAAHEIYDRRTSRGLAIARGQVLSILEDYGVPDPDWCEQIVAAHRSLEHGVIGGAVEQDAESLLNWTVYFLDFGRYQLPLTEGPVDYLTDVNISYKKATLERVRELWEDRYNEVTVNWALARQGVVLWQRPQIVARQNRGKLSFRALLAERFWWGRLFGQVRSREISFASKISRTLLSPVVPLILIARITLKILRGKRNRVRFFLSLPHILVMSLLWCLGEAAGYIAVYDSSVEWKSL